MRVWVRSTAVVRPAVGAVPLLDRCVNPREGATGAALLAWPHWTRPNGARPPETRLDVRPRQHHRLALLAALAATSAIPLGGCADRDDQSAPRAPATAVTDAGSGARSVVVHRSPTCGCCKSYEEYLRKHGYQVESVVTEDLEPIKAEHGIPEDASSCHTTIIEGYAVEGHVPTEAIEKLLTERPDIKAIALPGMPSNSPGMGDPNGQPLKVVAIDKTGQTRPFASA